MPLVMALLPSGLTMAVLTVVVARPHFSRSRRVVRDPLTAAFGSASRSLHADNARSGGTVKRQISGDLSKRLVGLPMTFLEASSICVHHRVRGHAKCDARGPGIVTSAAWVIAGDRTVRPCTREPIGPAQRPRCLVSVRELARSRWPRRTGGLRDAAPVGRLTRRRSSGKDIVKRTEGIGLWIVRRP